MVLIDWPPSHSIDSSLYLRLTNSSIQCTFDVDMYSVSEDDEQYADKPVIILYRQLVIRVCTRLPICLSTTTLIYSVSNNLNQFAALLCFYGQVQRTTTMNPESCLLQYPSCGGFTVVEDIEIEGNYLHYSNEEFSGSGVAIQ